MARSAVLKCSKYPEFKKIRSSPSSSFSLFLNTSFLFLISFFLLTVYLNNPNTSIDISDHQYHNSYTYGSSRILNPSSSVNGHEQQEEDVDGNCGGIHDVHGYKAKCAYVKSNEGCKSDGYIDYLQLFYCTCGKYPLFLGYPVLFLWLILLFYLLGNTAASYFCSSLESLSKFLKLSPTLAGVTLLSLGNGAPDVFASLVSFTGASGTGDVGLNSVLGGAFFVSSVVVGIISISISPRQISVDKSGFIRDLLFFLLAIGSLLLIVMIGRINIWGAVGFVSLYFLYVFIVSTSQLCKDDGRLRNLLGISPMFVDESGVKTDELSAPLLSDIGDEEPANLKERIHENIDRDHVGVHDNYEATRTCCFCSFDSSSSSTNWQYFLLNFLYILELPLYLPRRLTIPVISEENWSKPFAVSSLIFAPVLLATLWNSYRGNMGSRESLIIYLISSVIGLALGTAAFFTTDTSSPPKRCLLPWLAGGFLMSVTWTYIIAEELVALLVSLGTLFGISPSILGLTLLAWGNSLGDLIANVAMAVNGEEDSVQVAISGCYAGPIFNTIIGLGLSLVFSSWATYPNPYTIPSDPYIYETMGFLAGGLLWALIILPRKEMKLDRILGLGLIAIYLCFLSVRLSQLLVVLP